MDIVNKEFFRFFSIHARIYTIFKEEILFRKGDVALGKCTEKGGEIRAKTKNSLVFFLLFFEHFLNGIFFTLNIFTLYE